MSVNKAHEGHGNSHKEYVYENLRNSDTVKLKMLWFKELKHLIVRNVRLG